MSEKQPAADLVIRAEALDGAARRILDVRADLLVRADEHRALLDANELRQAAEADAATIRETARQAGLADGMRQVAACLEQADEIRARAAHTATRDIAVLAVATARKLIDRELTADPALALALVDEVVADVADARQIRITIGPVADTLVEDARRRLSERLGGARFRLEVDHGLRIGDCVVDSELGRIDARLDIQLETLLRALLQPETA